MSLDIYLHNTKKIECDCGRVHEMEKDLVFDANITHNLNSMAAEAGIYEALWRPEEIRLSKAGKLAEILNPAIRDMDLRPDHYRQFNSPNGWGKYEHFMPWLERLRDACEDYPNATISVSR